MSKIAFDKFHLRDNEGLNGVIYHDVHHPLCYCEEFQQKVYTSEQNQVQRRFPHLKEYAQIKQNMDLQEQLHMQMKQNQDARMAQDNSHMHGSGRQSDPSGGVSAFRGGASMDGMGDVGIPNEKFVVGGAESGSELVASKEQMQQLSASAAAAGNEDLQGMYERIIGTSNNTAEEKKVGDKRMSGDGTSVMGGTLIHNPTINQ